MLSIRNIERVDTKSGFACGVQVLDEFFAKRAWEQHSKNRANRVYVLVDEARDGVLGFYTLCAKEIVRSRLQDVVPKSAPPYPLGVFYIGYFAVAKAHQGQGFGSRLTADALRRCAEGAETFGVVGVVLDSLNEGSTAFYRRLGFVEFAGAGGALPDGPTSMILPIQDLLATRTAPS